MMNYPQRLQEAGRNPHKLRQLADELRFETASDAVSTRLRAIKLAMELSKQAKPVSSWLDDLGLPPIDSRLLYQYRLSDENFAKLEADLKRRHHELAAAESPIVAAKFVLWCSEWFRRHYNGSTLSWDAVTKPLGFRASQVIYRELTDTGLRHWGIPKLRINGTQYRLAAIARQGGFPLAAVEAGGGWAPRFLERLVGLLLNQSKQTLDVAERAAAALISEVPPTWQSREIQVVSAELALAVVCLRRAAEQAGATGQLVSAWLDRNKPAWREELPLSATSSAGRTLMEGLLKAPTLRGSLTEIGARRVLRIKPGGGYSEQVELDLSGSIAGRLHGESGQQLANEWSRLRLFASGSFARHVSGELATAEPGDHGAWIARPTTSRTTFDLPFDVAVTVELRGGADRIGRPFVIPGGDPVRNEARVWLAEDHAGDAQPQTFVLLGTGSGGFRPDRVYVDIPQGWDCDPQSPDSRCEGMAFAASNRAVWCVEGSAVIRTSDGDLYLVRTGQQAGQRDRLRLDGRIAPWVVPVDAGIPVFTGAPSVFLVEANRDRPPRPGELWWRPAGRAAWRVASGSNAVGLGEFAWRDQATRQIRAKTEAVILPGDFALVRNRSQSAHELSLEGWPGDASIDTGVAIGPRRWRMPLQAGTPASCVLALCGVDGASVTLTIPLPHDPWIYSWSSDAVPRNGQLSLSTLNGFVARAATRCDLLGQVLDADGRRVPGAITIWRVDGELPLTAIHDDLAAMLRPWAQIDATIELSFPQISGPRWRVSEFDHTLDKTFGGFAPSRAVVDPGAVVAGRATICPADERIFGTYSLHDDPNHRPITLPSLKGDWLIYLRAGDRVLSRPRYAPGAWAADPGAASPLGAAMAIRDSDNRRAAILAAIDAAIEAPSRDSSYAVFRALIDLALSLDGLRPATFDALRSISECAPLGPALLFFAAPGEVGGLMRLVEGLPVAWWLLPRGVWEQAEHARFNYLASKLPDALQLIAQDIGDRRKAIASEDPVLEPLLNQPQSKRSLDEAANAFLNQIGDRPGGHHSPFRSHCETLLPAWKYDAQFWRLLDAPVAAALTVSGLRPPLTMDEIMCAKDVARRHPRWFREGFAASLRLVKP